MAEKNSERLRLTEIFYSLQGESRTVGWPTIFVRLTGCPLRCGYCDTAYAFQGGNWWTISDIAQHLKQYKTRYVTVTGGEPLAQPNCIPLLAQLCDQGYEVSLETSGALDVALVDARVIKVMDIKTPGSGEESKNKWENIAHLQSSDQVKFVLCSRADYDWAKAVLTRYSLSSRCEVLFSPAFGLVSPTELAEWLLQDQLAVRFQLQLHKILWGEQPGR